MLKWLIYFSLTLSLGTGYLAVWVFNTLRHGNIITPDKMNELEFWIALFILCLVGITLITFIKRNFIMKVVRPKVKAHEEA